MPLPSPMCRALGSPCRATSPTPGTHFSRGPARRRRSSKAERRGQDSARRSRPHQTQGRIQRHHRCLDPGRAEDPCQRRHRQMGTNRQGRQHPAGLIPSQARRTPAGPVGGAVSGTFTYRRRATPETKKARICGLFDWSEWSDSNTRPPRPERGALPDCATLRDQWRSYRTGFRDVQGEIRQKIRGCGERCGGPLRPGAARRVTGG